MNIQPNSLQFEKKQPLKRHWCFIITILAFFAGLLLSILSWLEICVEHCSANADYRIFGFPFAITGMLFFTSLIFLQLLSIRYSFLKILIGWLVAIAIGSEILFIGIQKYQIGRWCPVCMSIAASVGVAGIALSINYFKNFYWKVTNNKGGVMQALKQSLIICSFILFGFFTSFVGVSKIDAAQVAMTEIREKLVFGNRNGPVEIYIFSDWFCPSCKKIEPVLEKIFPKIKDEASIYFVDYPIHKKSENFIPYNLSFIVHNKSNYFQARRMLQNLADKTDNPTDEDVIEAAQKQGIHFNELSYADVKSASNFFENLVEKYKLNATPVVIISNKKGSKIIKLEGRDEITEKRILAAIEKVEKGS